jgi:hypothetical protein
LELTKSVRALIHASDSERELEERELCLLLSWELGRLLQSSIGWSNFYWIERLLPDLIEVISPIEVNVRGRLECAGYGNGCWWIEPFFGSVRLTETGDSIAAYRLMCGNADRGLGQTPYGTHIRREDWFRPAAWLFAFTK